MPKLPFSFDYADPRIGLIIGCELVIGRLVGRVARRLGERDAAFAAIGVAAAGYVLIG